MPVVNKEKYLREIASLVRKGSLEFAPERRPSLEMGGRTVYVKGVSFDIERGELGYEICSEKGDVLSSVNGFRPLARLDQRSLLSVRDASREAFGARVQRGRNLSNIESRVRAAALRRSGGLNL